MREFHVLLDPNFPNFSALNELLENSMQYVLHEKDINTKVIVSYYDAHNEKVLKNKKFDLFLLNTNGSSKRVSGYNINDLKQALGKEGNIFILHQCDCGCDRTINETDGENILRNKFVGYEILANIRNTIIKMCSS